MKELLLRLIDHMRWADALIADALDANPEAEAVRLFAHIASVEHLWYARTQHCAPNYPVWPSLSPSESRRLAAEHADLFAQLVRTADDATLHTIVAYRNSAGRDFRNTIADVVTHTTMHGEHHRGQIARIMRAAGHEPPYTDYIQFARRDQG